MIISPWNFSLKVLQWEEHIYAKMSAKKFTKEQNTVTVIYLVILVHLCVSGVALQYFPN